MVIMLAGVVEHRGVLAERALYDLFERLVFPLRAFESVIAVVDIGQMMFVVMKFERLARHDRGQRVVRVRQVGQGEGHGTAPWEVRGRIGTPTDVRSLRDSNLAAVRRRGNSIAKRRAAGLVPSPGDHCKPSGRAFARAAYR